MVVGVNVFCTVEIHAPSGGFKCYFCKTDYTIVMQCLNYI